MKKDLKEAYDRISEGNTILSLEKGDIQYSVFGSGEPVLVIHGAGGGFDQGELIGENCLPDGYMAICPSRIGYLGSSVPEGADWSMQAQFYRDLIDHLEIKSLPVLALSAGGASAIQFAADFPERVTGLVLLSTCGTIIEGEEQEKAEKQGKRLLRIFHRDAYLWFISKLFERSMLRDMGVTDQVLDELTPYQRSWTRRYIDYMHPASMRKDGAYFDNRNPVEKGSAERVQCPALIIHSADDTIQLYENALYNHSRIENSELFSFSDGGHFVGIIKQKEIRSKIEKFLLDNKEKNKNG